MKKILILAAIIFSLNYAFAQNNSYWQQHVDYKMDVTMNVKNYQYKGKQELVYTNNSKDTLRKVYYHLYFNAFQPNSEMDNRLQNIPDPDGRMSNTIKVNGKDVKESRIAKLLPNEIGFLKVTNLKQDGATAIIKEIGTVLEVTLTKPLLPYSKTVLTLDFDGQVPVHIRRAGRNNAEGIEFSMAQWYPKMAEYDFEGWHANPYIAREFHGVWGNFDVKINIDKNYVLGGSGYLQNPNQIGHGYQDKGIVVNHPKNLKTLTWHFVAPNVHDFTFAADKNYLHDVLETDFGTTLHFLYKNNPKIIENWKNLQPKMAQIMKYFNNLMGKYPYKQYSFIQGGDGGMEYAMCTLILGEGTFDGLLSVATHELGHSWFQHVLATNETKHSWMDEGFTSYLEEMALNEISEKKQENPHLNTYQGYYYLAKSGKEQPQTTHSDRYDFNQTYSISAYSKGHVFLTQLEYLIGKENLNKTLKKYYQDFKFKHPTPNDFKRTAEKISGAHLDWYLTDWTQTSNTIDYGIKTVNDEGNATKITLERIGRIPMPIEILVDYVDGTQDSFYIPLRMLFFEKENPNPKIKRTVLNDWAWANPVYSFLISKPKSTIKKITIDPSGLMADVKQENNILNFK